MKIESEFAECDECRVKPGSPILCNDCYTRRRTHEKFGACRPPRVCSPEVQAIARQHDEDAKNFKLPAGVTFEIVESPRSE